MATTAASMRTTIDNHGNVLNQAATQNVHGNMNIYIQGQELASKLPYVAAAASNSAVNQHKPLCLNDTRVDVLRQIRNWSRNPDSKCIYWLRGMAGTGKSTIARTIASEFQEQRRLAASFCFSRGEGDLGHAAKLISTMAFQLLKVSPILNRNIRQAIDQHPDISKLAFRDQWKHLIYTPLSTLTRDEFEYPTILLVIDALDECEGENDVKLIIQLLAESKGLPTVKLRAFVTSRPETPIRLGFDSLSEDLYQELILHQISRLTIEHDITIFLQHEFKSIQRERRLPEHWPGEYHIEMLTKKAGGLFIYAATVCLFIKNSKFSPIGRLSRLLNDNIVGSVPEKQLDRMYTEILKHSFAEIDDELEQVEWSQLFKLVCGSIIVLSQSLSAHALSELQNIPLDNVNAVLESLRSVLDVPEDQYYPIRLLHPSFRDFLLDRKRCTDDQLWVDDRIVHSTLVRHCFRTMRSYLKRDICGLKSPGILIDEIDQRKVTQCLPAHLQYACQYWISHLRQLDDGQREFTGLCDGGEVHIFLRDKLLYWLEALSLTGKLTDAILTIRALKSMVTPGTCPHLFSLIHDANRFILRNRSIFEEAPLQIYYSALVFSPQSSETKKKFAFEAPRWIKSVSEIEEIWTCTLQTLEGHSRGVWAVAFSPDGQLVASGSEDGTVRLWDAVTGSARGTLEGHTRGVRAVAFSPDSQLVASGSWDSTVRLWDAATGSVRGTLEGHWSGVRAVAFSPDGQLVSSESEDRTVKIWDTTTKSARGMLEDRWDTAWAVVFSPDGQLVASGSSDGPIGLWDVATGSLRGILEGHWGTVHAVAFSLDGQLMVSGSGDTTVRLWDTATKSMHYILQGHSHAVRAVAFSPDGQLVASGSEDRMVRLWDVVTGSLRSILEGHSGLVWAVTFSPDGQLVTSGSEDGMVRFWDVVNSSARGKLEERWDVVKAVAFSSDGRLVASGSKEGMVRLWDTATGSARGTLEGHSDLVWTVVFSPDSQLVASGSEDGIIRLWDAATGLKRGVFKGHSGAVYAVAFSPDSQLVASGSEDGTVRLWDAAMESARGTLKGYWSWARAAASSPDGQLVASTLKISELVVSGSKNGMFVDCDVVDEASLRRFRGCGGAIKAVAFSTDGQLIALNSIDNTVKLWNVATGSVHATLEGYAGLVWALAFSPDGQLVASGSKDGRVELWDAVTGSARGTFKGHSDAVNMVAFSPDSQLVASGSEDGTVRLWDVATGSERGTPKSHFRWRGGFPRVMAVAFSPDGQFIASGSENGTFKLWNAAKWSADGAIEHDARHMSFLPRAVAFSPDGRLVAMGLDDSTTWLWNVAMTSVFHTLKGHSDVVFAVAFSLDGQLVASGSKDGTVKLWDVVTGSIRATLSHSGAVYAVAFSPDSQLVASGSEFGLFMLWDVATGSQRNTLEGRWGMIKAVAFSPSGQLISFRAKDSTVKFWDMATGSVRVMLKDYLGLFTAAVFSPDGQLVASGSENGMVRLWDAVTGSARGAYKGHSGAVNVVVFSPDSQLVASGSEDGAARLWNAATGSQRAVFQGYCGVVKAVAFSPDGQLVALKSEDDTVKLWDAATGLEHGTFKRYSGAVYAVAFSPDGQLVASGSEDGIVRLWDLATRSVRSTLKGHSAQSFSLFSQDSAYLSTQPEQFETRAWPLRPIQKPSLTGLSLSRDKNWVLWRGCRCLWLPSDLRVERYIIRDGMVLIRHLSGRLIFLNFDLAGVAAEIDSI